jgi:YgiT-type zinc finger domain-containing protein
MRCHRCRTEDVVSKRQDHRYLEAGLPNVVLKNVECRVCRACGFSEAVLPLASAVRAATAYALHGELALAIVSQRRFLTSHEVSFLLKWMDWTPEKLSTMLGIEPHLTSIWTTIGPGLKPLIPADRLLRYIVADFRFAHSADLVKILPEIKPDCEIYALLEASFDRMWCVSELPLGPLARAAETRPENFYSLSTEERWAIDKELGLLDWDGKPSS